MTAKTTQRPVHLVGSVPLADEEVVFNTVSTILGERVRRIPDGETGVRALWCIWQAAVLANNPSLEEVRRNELDYEKLGLFRLRADANPDKVAFSNLGYADAATTSYQTFARLKEGGIIGAKTRFLVCLPTPFAVVTVFVDRASQAAVYPAYEAQMLAEIDRISAAIPHDQLAIQWDTAVEFASVEGVGHMWPSYIDDVRSGSLDKLERISSHVPSDVELGYHFCYGDLGHKHYVEPKDSANLVAFANDLTARVARPINFLHMPVPRDRVDEAYFAPLANLKLRPETEFYLGLIHFTDGVPGAQKRMDVAEQFVPKTFGISTECGFGRRPVETIAPLLAIHRSVADNNMNGNMN